jgi:glycosyltransferase involved in cell wall biosynthesis
LINRTSCCVIVPARNEERNLGRFLDLLPEYIDEVVVVVGNSRDNTLHVAVNHVRPSIVLTQSSKGKGAALSLGFQNSTADLVAIIDSDGSMDSDELRGLFLELLSGVDVVKGSRYTTGGGSIDLTWFRSIGNRFLTFVANWLFKQKWTDLAYGLAAFRRSALDRLELYHYDEKVAREGLVNRGMSYGQGFEIETLMFCRSARRGLTVKEIPSQEHERWNGDSNLLAIPDGVRAGIALILERLRSKRNNFE